MAIYKVLERSYINDKIVEVGDEVEYDGLPSSNLEPIDASAKKAAKEADKVAKAAADAVTNAVVSAASVDPVAAVSAAASLASDSIQTAE